MCNKELTRGQSLMTAFAVFQSLNSQHLQDSHHPLSISTVNLISLKAELICTITRANVSHLRHTPDPHSTDEKTGSERLQNLPMGSNFVYGS